MIDWVLKYWANVWIAVGLYWLPLALCAFGYFLRTWRDVQKDKAARFESLRTDPPPGRERVGWYAPSYHPSVTIGTLLGRGLVSICPIANLCAAIFDVAPELFGKFFEWIGRVFDQPLVPKPKAPQA